MTTSQPAPPHAAANVGPDPARSRLRSAVARVERALSAPPAPDDGVPPAPDELRTSWAALVEILALGPEPALRACPRCNQLGMRDASRCGSCWAMLAPLPPVAT